MKGKFYGTTGSGGPKHVGTVFSYMPAGLHKVLHFFAAGKDGANPMAAMVKLKGALYGLAPYGPSGALFKVSAAGAFSVVYNFKPASDGYESQAGLIAVGNSLYGTNANGGANSDGTVFKVTP